MFADFFSISAVSAGKHGSPALLIVFPPKNQTINPEHGLLLPGTWTAAAIPGTQSLRTF